MRHLPRAALRQATLDMLHQVTQEVTSAADPKAKAKARWKAKSPKLKDTFDEVRAALEAMASGHARCMYCEDSLGTDIDHFWPKADFPDRAFTWENYLLACSYCNSNLKRNQFPRDAAGQPELLDPTVDEPAEHLFFLPGNGRFLAIGPKGHQSIAVFGLNDNAAPRQLPAPVFRPYSAWRPSFGSTTAWRAPTPPGPPSFGKPRGVTRSAGSSCG
ncbi:MAG: hypothetical protein IPI35_20530 [Deltaproteobacteria bacterium]|nr:hypothetical protein [Deltaproteobacteria bacterium]